MQLKRILVLDDHQEMLDVVEEALTYERFKVETTSDSGNILSIAQNFKPDLLIMDYKLIGGTSADICYRMKNNTQLDRIPIIICSAYINDTMDAYTCGCDALIAKPFGLDELMTKVNGLIAS
jgi:DNA-binding response OmpR family regulator